jgi:hypothetical protein
MVKRLWLYGLFFLGLAGCGTAVISGPESENTMPASLPVLPNASLPDLGPAPELANQVWLNVDAPLRLAGLRGKVVAIDMWTFG